MHHTLTADCACCSKCQVLFSTVSSLADWAYCLEMGSKPSRTDLEIAEEEADKGNYTEALRLGLFRLETDDGCDLFQA